MFSICIHLLLKWYSQTSLLTLLLFPGRNLTYHIFTSPYFTSFSPLCFVAVAHLFFITLLHLYHFLSNCVQAFHQTYLSWHRLHPQECFSLSSSVGQTVRQVKCSTTTAAMNGFELYNRLTYPCVCKYTVAHRQQINTVFLMRICQISGGNLIDSEEHLFLPIVCVF